MPGVEKLMMFGIIKFTLGTTKETDSLHRTSYNVLAPMGEIQEAGRN